METNETPKVNCKVKTLDYVPSIEEFLENYMKPGVPVVMKNALPSENLWNLQFLIDQVGHREVPIRKNTNHENYKVGKAYYSEKMKFAKYAAILTENEKLAANYYLAAVNLKTEFPEIANQFHVPLFAQKVHHGPYLWISSKKHYEFCHVDSDDGVLCILSGKKKVYLYSYNHFFDLYPNPLGSKGRTIQSRINIAAPDENQFPNFKNAICEECDLVAGDILFIPSFYWHQVNSEDAISINFFCGDNGENDFLQKMITTRWDPFMYWFDNILEQNRASLPKIVSDFSKTLRQFFCSQFREQASEEQLQIIIKHALEKFSIDESSICPDPNRKHATRLKIRGLMWRGLDDDDDDSKPSKATKI